MNAQHICITCLNWFTDNEPGTLTAQYVLYDELNHRLYFCNICISKMLTEQESRINE
jgi:hypothetical protein